MSGASREMGRWRGRLNTFFLPRADLTSASPPIDLRLPDWYIAAMCAAWGLQLSPLLLIMGVMVAPDLIGGANAWFLWVFIPCQVAAAIGTIAANRGLRRQVRSLSAEGKIPCLSCHYGLEGLRPQGECPECGRLYDHADVSDSWRRLRFAMRVETARPAGESGLGSGLRTPPPAPPAAADPSADR